MLFSSFFFIFLIQTISSEFCKNHLFESKAVCEDGSVVMPNGCCRRTNRCPKSCMRYGWRTRGRKTTCTCSNCALKPKVDRTESERWLKAHNFFRCRHKQPLLHWSPKVAANAKMNTDQCIYSHSSGTSLGSSYNFHPPSGENIAMGFPSIEGNVETWYNEISLYRPGSGFTHGVGHYTAMMWESTTSLGCSKCDRKDYVVCEYANSPPNFGGRRDYVKNVPQSQKPLKSEAQCCAEIYGAAEFLSQPSPMVTGAEQDEHGCIPSAGYSWCESRQVCYRDFEEECPIIDETTNSCHVVQISVSSDSASSVWSFGLNNCQGGHEAQIDDGDFHLSLVSCCLFTERVYHVSCSLGTNLRLNGKEICRGKGSSHILLNPSDESLIVKFEGQTGELSPGILLATDLADPNASPMADEAAYIVGGILLALIICTGLWVFWCQGVSPSAKPTGYHDLPEGVSI